MQVKKKPRNAAAKKIHKAPPKEKRTKKEQAEQPFLKRMIFGEERPDITELEPDLLRFSIFWHRSLWTQKARTILL